jgi:DNA-binding NarL/FixJ family response regulator
MKILIASAEAAFGHEIRTLLESAEGITTVDEGTSPQIVDQVQEFQPDLILLDLDSGKAHPPDIVSTLCRRHPEIKILVMGAPGQEQHVLEALRDGAHGHLTKGVNDREHLIAALQAVDRGGAILSPAMAGLILDQLSHPYHRLKRARIEAVAQGGSLNLASDRQAGE